MAKINREEYEALKGLDYKWKWIARDEDTSLWVFTHKPFRKEGRVSSSCWGTETGRAYPVIELIDKIPLFRFIQWEDEEPYSISELIEEYEIENGTRDDFEKIKIIDIDISKLAIENAFIYVKESEETEVKKNIEWLKKEVGNMPYTRLKRVGMEDYVAISKSGVFELINQLDEPEVLSQELPIIPKLVADWIEDNKQLEEKWNDYSKEDAVNDTIHFTIYGLFADYPATNSHVELRKPVLKWLSDDRGNYFKLINAVRYGYEVEKEPKYVVRTNLGTYLILDTNKREWDYTSTPPQDDDIQYAYKFDDRSMAEGIAKLVEGKVEELD